MSAALDSEPVASKIEDAEDDLFGDDSDEEVVASEDEDAIKSSRRKHRDIDADDDEDDLGLGDSDEEADSSEEQAEDESLQRAELSLARHPKSHQPEGDVLSFNLPRYLFVDPEPFGPETFESSLNDFIEENKKNSNKNTTRELQDSLNFKKLQIRNTIRWRYAKTEDDELYKQSNTRIIEWEDGSLSLKIGDEIFDIRTKNNEDNLLAFLGGQVLISTLNMNKAIQVTPTSTNSFAHKILAKSLASDQAVKKSKKINSIVTKEDPTKVQREVEKAQKEIERARRKQALKLQMEEDRLGRRKVSNLASSERRYTGIDADEDDDDEDDEDGIYNRRARVTSNGYEEDDFVVEDEEGSEGEDLADSDDDEKLEAAAERLRKVKEAGAADYDGSKKRSSESAEDDEVADDDDDGAVVRKKRRVVLNEDDDDE